MLTWTTAGESHGPSLVAIAQGVPAGIALTSADIQQALTQRRQGLLQLRSLILSGPNGKR